MDLKRLAKPLSADQIDFRIQSINNGGYATILAYKDARVDMQRLDDVVGALNWKREHSRDNHNCIVSIWSESLNQWVSKEDTGTESFTEAQKGLASDSFKRACFNWGIGRELYDYPLIQVKLKGDGKDKNSEWELVQGNKPNKQTWNLKLKEWKWFSQFDESDELTILIAKDQDNKVRFEWRNLKLVEKVAPVILGFLADNERELLAEAWLELEEWEENLLNTAISKGGWFNSEQKSIIKQAVYEFGKQIKEEAK